MIQSVQQAGVEGPVRPVLGGHLPGAERVLLLGEYQLASVYSWPERAAEADIQDSVRFYQFQHGGGGSCGIHRSDAAFHEDDPVGAGTEGPCGKSGQLLL